MFEDEFWLVWDPQGDRPPQHRHTSDVSARREAGRLALLRPGHTFYVLHATEARRAAPPAAIVLTKREEDDIPF